MTPKQADTLQRLQGSIKQKLGIVDEYNGEIFTENQGVTIKIGRRGGIELPTIRHYDDPFEAAVRAPELFRNQQEKDQDKPEGGSEFGTGHLNPRWDPRTGRCVGNRKCLLCRSK